MGRESTIRDVPDHTFAPRFLPTRGGLTPLLALGGEGTALPMAAVVGGGAQAALLATVLLTRVRSA